MLIYITYRLINTIQAVKQCMHYVNCIDFDSEINSFMILIMNKSPKLHITQYNRKSIQTMYYISKCAFKLMKPAKIYKVHHYEIVFFSLSWIQIN